MREMCEGFGYGHSGAAGCVGGWRTFWGVCGLRGWVARGRGWDAGFPGYCLYVGTDVYWDFQVWISVPLSSPASCGATCIYHVYK